MVAKNAGATRDKGSPVFDTNHSCLRGVVRDCGVEALGADFVEEETRGTVEGSRRRPADVMLHLHTHTVAIDTTIVYVQTPTNCAIQAARPGAPVMEAEKEKRRKYAGTQFKDKSTRFVPFAVDDFGHIGDAGWALLEQLATYGAARNRCKDFTKGRTESEMRSFYLASWQQRIAHVVRSSVDRSMQRRLALSRQLTE